MTPFLMCVYASSAAAEIAGVLLVIKQIRSARARWQSFSTAIDREREMLRSDPRWALDDMYARYGFAPGEVRRTSKTVESLVAVNGREQALTVALLLTGILLGTVGNLASLAVSGDPTSTSEATCLPPGA